MKIAILHEMLIKLGGAEKVVEKLYKIFPNADLFTLIYDESKVGSIFPKDKINQQVFNLKSQKVYNFFKKQRFCLPFMPISIESLDFSNYDVVICSSSGFAHGAITKPETKFIVYYHSPARYLWDWTNEYKKDIGFDNGIKGYFLNKLFLKLRCWDYIASKRQDINLANSKNTKSRITKYYRKDSEILYPPVEINRFKKSVENIKISELESFLEIKDNKNYYIIISALTEFKKIEVAINGFNELNSENLLIIGGGDYREKLEDLVKGTNIKFLGPKFGDELVYLVQNSSGLIFPGEEDFGIVPIEVMASGKPVFAYKGGGLLETVLEGITGEFFDNKDGKDFVEKFNIFNEENKNGFYNSENCIKQAERFGEENFEKAIKSLVN